MTLYSLHTEAPFEMRYSINTVLMFNATALLNGNTVIFSLKTLERSAREKKSANTRAAKRTRASHALLDTTSYFLASLPSLTRLFHARSRPFAPRKKYDCFAV